MWLLKLQYEFYNPKFYDTERNFSHQSQIQEKKQKAGLRVTDLHTYQNAYIIYQLCKSVFKKKIIQKIMNYQD